MGRKSCFVSDLHLFCKRSSGEDGWNAVRQAAAEAHTLVFGGDVFDFRWTSMPSVQETAERAIQWLERLVAENPECHFHFVVGNHDQDEAFVNQLATLADLSPNLSWHPYYVRLGDSVFLHGDVANRRMDARGLERERQRWKKIRKQGRISNWVYDLAVLLRLHKLTYHVVYPTRTVVKRIVFYLEAIGHGAETGVTDVYFGHTHLAMSHFQYNGIRFHNSGAPMAGCPFRIIEDVISDT